MFAHGKEVYGEAMFLPAKCVHVLPGFQPARGGGRPDGPDRQHQAHGGDGADHRAPVQGVAGGPLLVGGRHRRFAAAKKSGQENIPAIVRLELEDDAAALALSLSITGEGQQELNPVELGRAFVRYMAEAKLKTPMEVPRRPAWSTSASRVLALMEGPEKIQKQVSAGELSFTRAGSWRWDEECAPRWRDRLRRG